MMTLYDFMGSGNGYKVRLVLAHLGLPYKLVERDILKAVMAQDAGHAVRRLVFIAKPGAAKKCAQPSSRAIIDWAARA